ncbi:MAG: hypothetical protein JWL69_2141 [Phycisphaerales bacterium]|nr:hypothetical protein [Phycisphaerales bacterium]
MEKSENEIGRLKPNPPDSVIRFLKVATLALLAAIFLVMLADLLRS